MWEIVTEREINQTKAKNIEWLAQAADLSQFGIDERYQELYCEFVINLLNYHKHKPLCEIFTKTEQFFGLKKGVGLSIYKNLAYRKKIDFDVSKIIDFTESTGGVEVSNRNLCE